MVIGHDTQLPPTIHHRQKAQVVVRRPLLRYLSQRKPVQDLVSQQQIATTTTSFEHSPSGGFDPLLQRLTMTPEHQLEQFGDGLRVLADLFLRGWVEDSKTGIDVPFVGVDPESDVYLDVLNAAYVTVDFPGKLVVCVPGGAHAEKGGVCDGLRVCCDPVVCLRCEVDVLGAETR